MQTSLCEPRRNHQASAHENSQGSEQLSAQIPTLVMLNKRPTDRRPRQRRNADPQKDKRDPNAPLRIVVAREIPNGRIIQPLDGAREEAVEARDEYDSGMGFCADPDEQEDGGEEDAGDNSVNVAEVAVREEGREQATWEVCRIHED